MKWHYFDVDDTVKPIYNNPVYSGHPVYHGHRTTSRKSCLIFTVKLTFFFINNIYCNICSKSLEGSSRELTLLTFEYFKNTNVRQD